MSQTVADQTVTGAPVSGGACLKHDTPPKPYSGGDTRIGLSFTRLCFAARCWLSRELLLDHLNELALVFLECTHTNTRASFG